jgi:hypothetical protein
LAAFVFRSIEITGIGGLVKIAQKYDAGRDFDPGARTAVLVPVSTNVPAGTPTK